MKSPEDNHGNGEIPRCNSAAVIAEHAVSPPPANDEDSDGEELPSGGRQPTAASNMSSVLAIPCHSLAELKENVTLLLPYTVYSCEERACKLLVARSKDAFLETCTPECYGEVENVVHKFVDQSRELVESVDEKRAAQLKSSRSPLLNAMQQQRSKFISRFHENKRQKLGNVIDSEQWRPAEVPRLFQKIIDVYAETGVFADNVLDEGEEADGGIAPKDTAPADSLIVDDERYIVVGTSLLLLRMLAQYCSLLALFPQCASELLLNTVEILKNFNSRTCQLILGAGALQLIGLKTISVKHMALAARCLQLIARFIP
ncbi:vacuolar protein sorting-associated protein 54, partial [Aphelenchoides avenae]